MHRYYSYPHFTGEETEVLGSNSAQSHKLVHGLHNWEVNLA